MVKKNLIVKNPATVFVGQTTPQTRTRARTIEQATDESQTALRGSNNGADDRQYRIEARSAEVREMYNLIDVEKILNVSGRTVLTYIYSGRLKAVKIGRSWRVSEESLDAFLGR